jgi:hypothetical protein
MQKILLFVTECIGETWCKLLADHSLHCNWVKRVSFTDPLSDFLKVELADGHFTHIALSDYPLAIVSSKYLSLVRQLTMHRLAVVGIFDEKSIDVRDLFVSMKVKCIVEQHMFYQFVTNTENGLRFFYSEALAAHKPVLLVEQDITIGARMYSYLVHQGYLVEWLQEVNDLVSERFLVGYNGIGLEATVDLARRPLAIVDYDLETISGPNLVRVLRLAGVTCVGMFSDDSECQSMVDAGATYALKRGDFDAFVDVDIKDCLRNLCRQEQEIVFQTYH